MEWSGHRAGPNSAEGDTPRMARARLHDRLRADECARYLKALADAERLKIVQCLQDGPKNVSELAALLGRGLVNVSHHLQVLRHAGLVLGTRQGKYVTEAEAIKEGDRPAKKE